MNGPNNPIGWCDYTNNPVKGKCPITIHPWCYARRAYERFKWDPTIRFDEKELNRLYKLKEPARIFIGSMIELFGIDWIPYEWMSKILKVVEDNLQLTCQFLTEIPANLAHFTFSENCWCGTTVRCESELDRILDLDKTQTSSVNFGSFEPLHSDIPHTFHIQELDWVIIGAETGNRKGKIVPKEEWIKHIIDQADENDIPIFLKDNLKPYWHGELRQEFPE